ncbi:membrane protein [Mycobacterium sp. URHB0044]|uniref:membrane protein n=1 Tax=Mycobacterium sp. URHB0044 TaxID=1380386 RepID=UPI000492193E|nr:membrane protein [Mycobacterium sp. URHB0044]
MRRWIAVLWHSTFLILAAVLYFFFVLPRWPELLGDTSHTLGTALRIVTGALVGLAALPVVFTLLRTRKPELGTPQLALTLRFWSIALHVLAGVLIIGAAISEIWLSLDSAGQWLFGIYGAAAAIALLAALGFHLAFTAELPPPPPKPLKPKTQTRRRGRGKAADDTEDAETDETVDAEPATDAASDTDEKSVDSDSEAPDTAVELDEPVEAEQIDEAGATEETSEVTEVDEPANTADADDDKTENDEESAGKLRNRRPSGKSLFRRSRGGVALDD